MRKHFADLQSLEQLASQNPAFDHWRRGYGVIGHLPETQERVVALAQSLVAEGLQPDHAAVYRILSALDRLTSAGLWLVVHMTYANRVHPDGRPLQGPEFKKAPQGHTGGSLNMVPAYAAYMALNTLTGTTRSWLMGQGHCVAAIDAVNVLLGNLQPTQAQRYGGDDGLNRLVDDFYSYRQNPDGRTAAPLGSHVGPHTAGGILEGGYLGFAELQYTHLPLPGETLVTFLSDGAAEEQRGSDWGPRWWRAEDCGLSLPVMIANGRRIEQRSELGTGDGLEGYMSHLKRCGFDPVCFDGRDPAAFVCALFAMEQQLHDAIRDQQQGLRRYPLTLPFGIASTVKGYGFHGAGTNAAHNLPLPGNPRRDARARQLFNHHAGILHVPEEPLSWSIDQLNSHRYQQRSRERDHPLACRNPATPKIPELDTRDDCCSPMAAVDRFFQQMVALNPDLRPRVGNPDELASNGLSGILSALRHRVNDPENEQEAVLGNVITALNEEAVVSACLANKAGLNLVASYEAFCVKMLGAIRQELIFARHQKALGQPARWLGFPVIATSHCWENGKNEQSHQDTTFCEALLGEMNDGVRVLFPADYNSTQALLPQIYTSRGQIACMVIPKRSRPCVFTADEALALARTGAQVVDEDLSEGQPLLLIANGACQLSVLVQASERLRDTGTPFRLVYVQEPGRFRDPRDAFEAEYVLPELDRERLFPHRYQHRLVLTHMRPEVFRGHASLLCEPSRHTRVLGYINQGGTLDEAGMLFANQCSWAHALHHCAELLGRPDSDFLNPQERAAIAGQGSPAVLSC